jgi:acyl-CoA thioesterase I
MEWFRSRPAAMKTGPASYGKAGGGVQAFLALVALAAVGLMAAHGATAAAERPVKIVVLGDSLTAGLGLAAQDTFPAKLARVLQAKGDAVSIANAGVSGDTASDGLARLDWSVPQGTDAVIVELGANDALRGIDPKITRKALDSILSRLKARGIAVLLAGMAAPRNLGPDYVRAFDAIYPQLAAAHHVPLYPFFLDGVATDAKLNQADGMHPTAAGVDVIVARMLPQVEDLMVQVRAQGERAKDRS